MSNFAVDVPWSEWQRVNAVRALKQTYHMVYGFLERADQNFFRCPAEETQSRSPAAAVLREVTEQLDSGGSLRVRAPDKYVAACVSLLLQRTAQRDYPGNGELTEALTGVWQEWDRQLRLPADEQARLQLADYPNAMREQRAAEVRRRAEAERARNRVRILEGA